MRATSMVSPRPHSFTSNGRRHPEIVFLVESALRCCCGPDPADVDLVVGSLDEIFGTSAADHAGAYERRGAGLCEQEIDLAQV
jgi:hypothetical protein